MAFRLRQDSSDDGIPRADTTVLDICAVVFWKILQKYYHSCVNTTVRAQMIDKKIYL